MNLFIKTVRFTRGRLPHWEVENGRYFVTVRCHDSLPSQAVGQLQEIQDTLQRIPARSVEFAQQQRRYFITLEKYLDAGAGSARLRHKEAAVTLVSAFDALADEGVTVPHFASMPNHWHALLVPTEPNPVDLHGVMARLKGRTARAVNLAIGPRGTLWQREWFDRWMRNEGEWARCVEYIRQNPVKAGLVSDWRDDPWTR